MCVQKGKINWEVTGFTGIESTDGHCPVDSVNKASKDGYLKMLINSETKHFKIKHFKLKCFISRNQAEKSPDKRVLSLRANTC